MLEIFHIQNTSIKIRTVTIRISICLRCLLTSCFLLEMLLEGFCSLYLITFTTRIHRLLLHAADEWGDLCSRNSFMHEITLENFQKFPT